MFQSAPRARSGRATAAYDLALRAEIDRGATCSIVRLFDTLLALAHERAASDIHIDPTPEALRIRLRIDGVLTDVAPLPRAFESELISRIKVLAGLRTDEHQAPQDGRFRHAFDTDSIDVRVSVMPTYYGENAVLRLLADHGIDRSFQGLGFSEHDRGRIERALLKRSGMILATGPTGSGKTTTLYGLIERLNSSERAIVTIEDPIEYSIDSIEQVQVNQRTGLTFERGLRSILRQDPDIIVVGEIRDAETARVAVNAALTGHLLLSTLHTSDAITTLPRLADIGVDPYLIAATVEVAIAQRLVRAVCGSCRETRSLTKEERAYVRTLTEHPSDFMALSIGRGCETCDGTGYCGRLSINEVLVVDGAMRDAIVRRANVDELRQHARTGGMRSMLEDGLSKIKEGSTTLTEVLRVIHD